MLRCPPNRVKTKGPFRATYSQLKPEARDESLVAEKLAIVAQKLDLIEAAAHEGAFLIGNFSLADCALAPTALFLEHFLPLLGAAEWTDGRPRLAAWWGRVREQAAVNRALAEQRQALESTFGI